MVTGYCRFKHLYPKDKTYILQNFPLRIEDMKTGLFEVDDMRKLVKSSTLKVFTSVPVEKVKAKKKPSIRRMKT